MALCRRLRAELDLALEAISSAVVRIAGKKNLINSKSVEQ